MNRLSSHALAAICLAACSAAPPASLPVPVTGDEATSDWPQAEPEAPPPRASPPSLAEACSGVFQQGGLVVCQGSPGEAFRFGDIVLTADSGGSVQFGLARTVPSRLPIATAAETLEFEIAPRTDERRNVPGLDCDKIDARTPQQKAHAALSWDKKQAAFNVLLEGSGVLGGFLPPSASPPSSPFGPERRYTGVSKTSGKPCESVSVHLGHDYAAPPGSPVLAPAPGTVTLADPDLYYEGGTVFLDHGHGWLTILMHLSEVSVAAGDRVEAGQVIAKSGDTGRSSGPHLHWGVKWRNPVSTDRDGDFYIDPALLLAWTPPETSN
ncbi:MAG: M23 family metallopeptidase [Hyphomonas sp.]|nr:M23 family metallopeptidase [Hyphomonas sp.]